MLNIAAGNPITGYNLTRSLRFRRSATAYLNRTMTTPTDGKMWTYSVWRKLGDVGAAYDILLTARPGASAGSMQIVNGILRWYGGATLAYDVISSQTWRDPSAWYHFVFVYDTTQATAANRIKYYVNGVQGTFSSATYPALNSVSGDFNAAHVCQFGADVNNGRYSDGQYAEAHFIDGQALTPTSFGSYNSTTGVWQPAPYTGTYGTNGVYLPFTDNSALTTSSNVGLGKDFSGNGNYWTTNNISITAGVTYDSMTDVPTLTSATAANFAVLNPIAPNLAGTPTFAQANLFVNCANASNFSAVPATMQLPTTGKWYAEFTATLVSTVADIGLLGSTDIPPASGVIGSGATSYGYRNSGNKINNGSSVAYGASYTTGDVIAIAFDATAGSLTFYKNNVSQGVAFTGLTAQYFFAVGGYNYTQWTANFGQRPFSYTPPTGYVALNTYNLPTATILKGNTVMDATLYTGNGSTQTITNAAGFRPDLVWYKGRSTAYNNSLFDSVRGATKQLISNTTDAEATLSGVTAFNSNGFSLGSDANGNNNGTTYVGWQWQAGQGSSSSNTNGTITSTVSVNASAGFSIVSYTGNGTAGATIGHGLGVVPHMIITFARNTVTNHAVYHISLGNTKAMKLNLDFAPETFSGWWNNTSPTSSVFSVGTFDEVNKSSTTYVAYCWTPIAGYSAFGSFTGNGSSDGPFVYTGFRPRFVMFKQINGVSDWQIIDTARSPYNVTNTALFANLSIAETSATGPTGYDRDLLSNGFKMRASSSYINGNGSTYIYMAFAENPFKNALAR